MKFSLTINSHALSNFQRCEQRHAYADLISITVAKDKPAMDLGTFAHKCLRIYYDRKMRGRCLDSLFNPLTLQALIEQRLKLTVQDARKKALILLGYHKEYEKDNWTPLAIEKGFSKVLYEDDENYFVYEGRPDLVARSEDSLIVVDHKTQGSKYDYYAFNNQAIGYTWAAGAKYFCYNYIKWTNDECYRRSLAEFTPLQIEQWKTDTIEWFFRIKASYEKQKFLRSLNCVDKWGLCDYHHLCEVPTESARNFMFKVHYKQEPKYRSW